MVDAGAGDSAGIDVGLPASAACTPGVGTGPLADTEVSCNESATAFGVPNGVACYGKTYVLPKPLVVGADNALSFVLTGWGPYNFELWGSTNTLCKAEELLWWGPFGAGTQCAQFRPSRAYTHILFVYRQMYSANYSFATPSTMMCPGGTCPMGTTGTGKLTATPLTAPVGNYELGRTDRLIYGLDMDLGRTGRATVSWTGAIPPKKVNEAQPLSAGVFRMPATDPFGDAWYCTGDGSTLTEVRKDNFSTSSFQFSMRGVTRLGECEETAGTASISASIYLSSTTGTYFAADIAGTISAWNGINMVASPDCYGSACNMRFRNAGRSISSTCKRRSPTSASTRWAPPRSLLRCGWCNRPPPNRSRWRVRPRGP